MSGEKRMEIAKKYVDKQLKTVEKFGAAPKEIPPQEYKLLVEQVARTIKSKLLNA